MSYELDPTEARVLGALIEKEITTPEYYPLSLNALVNACNQKSSRDPVLQLDESSVREALNRLEVLNFAGSVHDSRVVKFEHHARQRLDLRRPEIAVLCLLLLRGPQTAGELRNRVDRLYNFEDTAAVQTTLERMSRPVTEPETKPRPALVTQLSRRPGEKESRYAHLLSGEPAAPATTTEAPSASSHIPTEKIERMEAELSDLRTTVETVMARLEALEGTNPQNEPQSESQSNE
jgi:hypothetical protein